MESQCTIMTMSVKIRKDLFSATKHRFLLQGVILLVLEQIAHIKIYIYLYVFITDKNAMLNYKNNRPKDIKKRNT